jgi:hypothetical protein
MCAGLSLPFRELNDDSELIDEEMVGGMDDDGDVVELSMSCEVFVVIVSLVLAKWSLERWAGSLSSDRSTEKGRKARMEGVSLIA